MPLIVAVRIIDMLAHNRRQFLAGLAVAGASGAAPKPVSNSKLKIGCCSWCFHSYAPGVNPEEAVDTIAGLGFDGVELILLAQEDIQGIWTGATLDRLQKKLEQYRLPVTQFVLFNRVVQDLASPSAEARARTLDQFEAGCKIAARLGAPILNVSSPSAAEMKGPADIPAITEYYDVNNPKPGEKFHLDLTPSFEWNEIWQRFVHTAKECLARAKAHGLRLTIEPHTNCLVHDGFAFLRLWDAIRDPALWCNLDIGFAARAREYPPVVIYQLNQRLLNVHMRDIDPPMRRFVNFGEGVIDSKAIADALKAIGYHGCATIEQGRNPGGKAGCSRYLETMRQYFA